MSRPERVLHRVADRHAARFARLFVEWANSMRYLPAMAPDRLLGQMDGGTVTKAQMLERFRENRIELTESVASGDRGIFSVADERYQAARRRRIDVSSSGRAQAGPPLFAATKREP